jgi:hypothetical protein
MLAIYEIGKYAHFSHKTWSKYNKFYSAGYKHVHVTKLLAGRKRIEESK